MMRRSEGGAAPHVLGAALMLLLLVGGLGLAESARAQAVRTAAMRALTAAVQSAARAEPAAAARTFQEVLRANLGDTPHRAWVTVSGTAVTGHIRLEHRMAYLARWLPPFQWELVRTEPFVKRNGRP
ncbi:MAG TPA: hypothetical protein VD902_01425 [Symbiobacteriaceae bacterium]|nr:hypothetical protein [Symbiobacteriaceae bacterium]